MRHPFWIINSTLLFLALVVFGFILLSGQSVPAREDIEPNETFKPIDSGAAKINISQIYQHDLFNTYKDVFSEQGKLDAVAPMPTPPTPQTPEPVRQARPTFLDPLNITLKGVIAILGDETKNRAIISDNNTQQEHTYMVQDMIEDAQVVRIFSNKVILLRSNGQQEVIYLREQDAKNDTAYEDANIWNDVAQKITDSLYRISPEQFTDRVKNLAQCIDMLDLTTVYENGKSIGVRIGAASKNDFRAALGLALGDIITTIEDMPIATNINRLQVYKLIIGKGINETIHVEFIRDGKPMEISYLLQDIDDSEQDEKKENAVRAAQQSREERIKRLEQRHAVAPTAHDIRQRERENMLKHGRSPIPNAINNEPQ